MNRVRQADLGTPASPAAETVKITIDGLPATARAGTSILRAARESGVDIPKLCATDSLKPFGSCPLCLVEIEGRKGMFIETDYVPTDERTNRKFPLLLTTGRILSQYNVGAQTRRTDSMVWYREDLLEVHPTDAEMRGIKEGDLVSLASRKGEIALRATITERVQPGVVYTTFHNPETGANVVTTEYSDWATSCPEYKVTAVQVAPASHRSEWQVEFDENAKRQGKIAETN